MATKRKPTSKPEEARRSLVQQLAAQIPWFHNCVMLGRVTEPSQREHIMNEGMEPQNLKGVTYDK